MTLTDEESVSRVLSSYAGLGGASVEPLGAGLINRTWRVSSGRESFVLQHVNRIFDPAIHYNIAAVTARLAEVGIVTPRLLTARDGKPFVSLGEADGVWRVMTFVEGVGFDVVKSAEQAGSAGKLVARFHTALDGLDHAFVGLRAGVHDTPRHLATLREALGAHEAHRLYEPVRALGEAILSAASALPSLPSLEPRVCHGDLKFNNILFEGPGAAAEASCLVDLDTVGPLALAWELGDAWRSWCNPHGEEREDAVFDLEVYAASLDGYLEGLRRALGSDEKYALVGGVEWISLELSARFAADALRESYFGWDPARYAGRGEHNLLRARSQWALHRAVVDTRAIRTRLLGIS